MAFAPLPWIVQPPPTIVQAYASVSPVGLWAFSDNAIVPPGCTVAPGTAMIGPSVGAEVA